MPFRWSAILAGLVILASCTPPVDTAVMPPVSGLTDPRNAIQYASWAFSSPARTRNDPASAARAVAALDYSAGAINTNPSLDSMSLVINHEMLDARLAVRRVLGIPPTAPSQAVVNGMVAASLALGSGDTAQALAALDTPIFTLGPQQTLAVLTNMPLVREANIATSQAEGAINGTFCALGCLGRR
jgi:hypothetical protein